PGPGGAGGPPPAGQPAAPFAVAATGATGAAIAVAATDVAARDLTGIRRTMIGRLVQMRMEDHVSLTARRFHDPFQEKLEIIGHTSVAAWQIPRNLRA